MDIKDSPLDNGNAACLVQEAVEEFSRTGHILSAVAEASVFRSPFYVRCFLPLLLSPLAKKNNIQEALIKALLK